MLQTDLFVDGAWVPAADGARLDVLDPATGHTIARVASATTEDVERAIEAAGEAFPAWAALPAPQRSQALRRWYDLILEHVDELAAILTAEQGKPLREAAGEIRYGAGFIEWYAEEAKRLYGETIPTNARGRRVLTIRQPVGVAAAITPWNFPDAFVERLQAAVRALRVGNGFDEEVDQGPLINEAAVRKVEEHIADALSHGARVTVGGGAHAHGGTFFEPTVLVGATPQMLIASDETFGPVAPLFRFETEEEAIALANGTESGLAAYFFTRDHGRAWRVGEALEFGVVGVNTGLISYEGAPFGGVKQSGLGREGSRHGIDEYLDYKYLCVEGI